MINLIDVFLSVYNSNSKVPKEPVATLFRNIAGMGLSSCGNTESSRVILEDFNLTGNNGTLTDNYLLDAFNMAFLNSADDPICLCTDRAIILSRGYKYTNVRKVSFPEALVWTANELGYSESDIEDDESDFPENIDDEDDECIEEDNIDEDNIDEDFPKDEEDEDDEITTGDLSTDNKDSNGSNAEEEKAKDPKEGAEEIPKKLEMTDFDKDILNYYSDLIDANVVVLLGRYTAQYESGYELSRFQGIITENGLASLSGSSLVYVSDYSYDDIYDLLKSRIGFEERQERSNIKIASRAFMVYKGNSRVLQYFPNKIAEYVYGRKAPTGDNQDSINTYQPHSEANNWVKYKKLEVEKSVKGVIKAAVLNYIKNCFDDPKIYREKIVRDELKGFLGYLVDCLSLSLCMVDRVVSVDEGEKKLSMIKIRICDPYNNIEETFMDTIINTVYSGNKGEDPFSYGCRRDDDMKLKEFAYEFNHKRSQATPLFAYKAFLSLREQGLSPTMENMILGKAEDGTVMRNGKNGVSLSNTLVHNIIAGSRAGKGVMTLNILAAGICSNRAIFYLDSKPDMATVFQHMCPEMFVVNGNKVESGYDDYGYFTSIDSKVNWNNVPEYARKAFSLPAQWKDAFGGLFYLRALKLVLGLIIGRGMGGNGPEFNGDDGIMLVADEFTIVSDFLSDIYDKATEKLPNGLFQDYVKAIESYFGVSTGNSDSSSLLKKLEEGSKKSSSESAKNLAKLEVGAVSHYTEESMYALTWLNSLAVDLTFIDTMRKASFSDSEKFQSDIFLIGQDIKYGSIDTKNFSKGLSPDGGARYKIMKNGLSGEGRKMFSKEGSTDKKCFLVNYFEFRPTMDAFFGRNDNTDILQMANPKSKAKGRLDSVANNFMYMSSYSNTIRKNILTGGESYNINKANEGVYFKPFLVLNANTSTYVNQMMDRVESGKVDPYSVMQENAPVEGIEPNVPFYEDTGFTNMVGFEGYLQALGVSNLYDNLKKSGDIMNHIVQDLIGYPGTWFDFVTDMRVEWMFTVEDIANLVAGTDRNYIKLFDRSTNPIFSEWNKFCLVTSIKNGTYGASDDDVARDFSDYESEVAGVELADHLSRGRSNNESYFDEGFLDNEDEIDLFDDEDSEEDFVEYFDEDDLEDTYDEDNYIDSSIEPEESTQKPINKDINSSEVFARLNKLYGFSNNDDTLRDAVERCLNQIELEKNRDLNRSYSDIERSINRKDGYISSEEGNPKRAKSKKGFENYKYLRKESDVIREEFDFSEGETITSVESVVKSITYSVIRTFGGLDRFNDLTIRGGSLFVNGHCYKMRMSNRTANSLPYDIREEIMTGQIASLFDYKCLKSCKNLRSLKCDSVDFMYDYVAVSMGYGSRVSVDMFFKDIPHLRELIIDKMKFTRESYKEQIRSSKGDMFYQPRFMTKVADVSEDYMSYAFKGSWSFTKKMAKTKRHGLLYKSAGVIAGTSATVATGATALGIKAVRKGASGIRRIGNFFGEAFSEYNKRK